MLKAIIWKSTVLHFYLYVPPSADDKPLDWNLLRTVWSQGKLDRTHRQKKKTNRLKNKRVQRVNRENIPPIYRKQITHPQSGNQTDMELRNRTVGLRQQDQHSHHAEIPIQNSQSHSKCTPVCNKLYSPYRLQHPLRKRRHPWINKNHNKLEAHPNPLLEPLLQPVNTRRLKLARNLTWHRWVNTLPRHCNMWVRSVLCVIITLAYRLYSFWLLIN